MQMTKDTTNSLSHTRWECKYHLVFAPKFRRQIVYGKIREDVGRILRTLCEQKKVEIHEAEACPDHIHTFVSFRIGDTSKLRFRFNSVFLFF